MFLLECRWMLLGTVSDELLLTKKALMVIIQSASVHSRAVVNVAVEAVAVLERAIPTATSLPTDILRRLSPWGHDLLQRLFLRTTASSLRLRASMLETTIGHSR
jgi:hypothetical protein